METTQIRIGRKIRSLRALAGISQEQLADRARIPQEHISRYERGKWKAVNPDHLIAIAESLGVLVDELVRGEASNGRWDKAPPGRRQGAAAAASSKLSNHAAKAEQSHS